MTRTLTPCGTEGAYSRHRRRGEPIDDVCRAARRVRDNARRARKRAGHTGSDNAQAVAAVRVLAQCEVRVVRLGGVDVEVGGLACSDVQHPFVPDGHLGTQCMACFGWVSDCRHTTRMAGRCPRCGDRLYSPAETEQHNRDVHNFGPVETTRWGAEP